MRPIHPAVFAVLIFGPALAAQSTPGPRRAVAVDHPAVQQTRADSHAGYQSFLARAGGNWLARFDEDGGTPVSIVGSGLEVSDTPIANLDVAAVYARQTLEAYPELWDAAVDELQLESALQSGRLFLFTWQQRFQGLEVHGAKVQIQVHAAGRVASIGTTAVAIPVGFSRVPALASTQAEAAVAAGKRLGPEDTVAATDFLVFVSKAEGVSTPRLAYVVDVHQPSASVFERVYVDANDGSVLQVEPTQHDDAKGKVTGLVDTALGPNVAPVSTPLEGIRVTVTGLGTATTDVNGDWSIATAMAGPFGVSCGLSGSNYAVSASQGTNLTASGTTSNVGGNQVLDFVFNNPSAAFNLSQTNVVYHHNFIRKYVQSKLPAFVSWPNQIIRVNQNNTCNAVYDDTDKSLNFYAAGGGCVNSAYSTVLYHEFGHGVDDRFGGISSSELSEAIGDICAMFSTAQPIIGQDFSGAGTIIRTGENGTVWPASSCGSDPHCYGETFMGFAWQARKKLITALGAGAGVAVAEADFLGTLPADNTSIPNAVTQVFLQDDDDGNLTNGTPHHAVLSEAAVMKGFTPPPIITMSVGHVPYPDTWNQTQPYAVVASVTPLGAATVASVQLSYAIGAGAFTNVAMTPTGVTNQWIGNIPAQVGPQAVSYRIVATDNAAHVLTVPPGDDAFRFAVGLRTTLFSDKLDTGAAGWTHTQVTQQDDWNLGDPQTLGTNGFDPATPFSGTACWGNDLQITSTSQNGLYQPNVDNYLESPNINASGHTGVRVRFRRWLTVESGQFDQARVFANGVQIWSNPQLTDLLDSTWTLQDVAATPANGAAAFKVRWRLTSDGGVEYGGWTIDDVEVYALEPTPVLTLNVTPSSTTPTVGTTLSFDLNGTSNAAWALFLSAGPGPSTVPGIGVALIDGSTLVQLDGGLLDPAGHAGSALPIPGIAGLVGLKLYWIGVVDTAAGLPQISNAFATTFQ